VSDQDRAPTKRPAIAWCSATQKRRYSNSSAKTAIAVVSRSASAGVDPTTRCQVENGEGNHGAVTLGTRRRCHTLLNPDRVRTVRFLERCDLRVVDGFLGGHRVVEVMAWCANDGTGDNVFESTTQGIWPALRHGPATRMTRPLRLVHVTI